VWNGWRREHHETKPNLISAELGGATLIGVNLRDAMLKGIGFGDANLRGADLRGADLYGSDLRGARLLEANLGGVMLIEADLSGADLRRADLGEASMLGASLVGADLSGADLSHACLIKANLTSTKLSGANVYDAEAAGIPFIDIDLRGVINLERIKHRGPSEVSISTIYRSQGKIPERFLRGCGVPEDFITYARSLTAKPIEFYSCFISYSSTDQEFAERLHTDLQAKGVRVWFAPHDMPIGARLRPTIDESIRV
jgi:uncharacterized protein YjbI with pentapeptide repeats